MHSWDEMKDNLNLGDDFSNLNETYHFAIAMPSAFHVKGKITEA